MKKILLTLSLAIFCLTVQSQGWVELNPVPGIARHHPICFALEGQGYLLCGNPDPRATSDPYLKDQWTYDPVADEWTEMEDFPGAPRGFGVGLNYNGKGYAGFGFGNNQYLNDLWEFDPETQEWTQLPSCPCLGRTHPAFLAAQGKIYVGLGGTGTNANDWWSYDLETKQWTEEERYPGVPRHHPYYFTVDDIPYVGFGHSANAIHNDFAKFNPATREWELMMQFPSHARVAGTHFTVDDKGYILAGDNELHRYDEAEMWEYDPPSDSWIQLPTFPEDGRWAPGAFVIGGTAYFTSGFARNTRVYHNDLWEYVIKTTTSTDEETLPAVSITPNPGQGSFQIEGSLDGVTEMEIIDGQGRILQNLPIAKEQDISTLIPGSYILRVHHPKGIRHMTVIRL